ncbi:HSF-type DNA-binding-domain-containing protein [Gaertneriomyces semiglobifer]|nr:HSF-type DNA-binding-domain-containing protein [Gaertneriomyces semiglobifer]
MVQKTTFIQKLYGLLSDSSHQHLITWSSSGTSFLILNAPQFSNQILPKTFKHNNYTSFVRQLNLYGFHKKNRSYHRGEEESRDTEPREFCHPRFLRGRTDLLCEIKRKGTGATSSSVFESHNR